MNDLRTRADTAVDSITRTVNHTDGLIVSVRPDVQRILSDGQEVASKVNLLVTDLNAGKGPAGMLLKDDKLKQQLQTTMSNVQEASVNLNHVSARADQNVADFNPET